MENQKKPVIGKYVIENLTTGMYSDARSVYREYIQNSADAIDKAIAEGILTAQEGEIHIEISEGKKEITFYDNGTGIPSVKVQDLLQNIAQSEKEIGKDKGFRGIGRLGGLAYCDELTFETSFKGEKFASVMVWNAQKLRESLADRENKKDAIDLIMEVTSFTQKPVSVDEHYFRVTLKGVKNNTLLFVEGIRDYLRFTAPAPFNSSFHYKSKIKEELKKENIVIDEYRIFVNTEQIFKGYKTILYKENNSVTTKIGDVVDVVFFKEYTGDQKLLYWGWHSLSNIQNVRLTKVNKGRGLRLRKHNIQIGDEIRLEKLFKDQRFNFYVFGEVYVFDKEFIPNGRRDDFEENSSYLLFQQKLKRITADISRLCNDASDIHAAKNTLQSFEDFRQKVDDKIQNSGVTNRDELEKFQFELNQKKERAEKAEKTLTKYKEIAVQNTETPVAKIFNVTVKTEIPKVEETKVDITLDKPIFRTDKLNKLNRAERKLISEVYAIIQDVLNPELADELIKKIEDKFK